MREETTLIYVCIFIVLFVAVGWVKNLIKLSDCDFKAPFKAEVIYTIGLFPPVGMVTGWLDLGI